MNLNLSHLNLVQWLFTDPISATGDSAHPEVFHFYIQWSIFNGALLLLWAYYGLEGRKRFFGGHRIHKYIMDHVTNQLALLGFVGFILEFMRWGPNSSFFAWRIWRYGWLLWLAILVVYWGVYMVRVYPTAMRQYRAERIRSRYMPQPKKRQARAGAR